MINVSYFWTTQLRRTTN